MFGLRLKPEITTPRLFLRPPEMRDAEALVAQINDADIARMTTGIPHPYSLNQARAFISMAEQADADIDLPLIIEHRQKGLAGVVGLHRREAPFAELGYWLGRDFWGQGLATEAGSALVQWAEEAKGRRALISGHFADNPASGRVLEKLGFLYTGEVKARKSYARLTPTRTRMMVRVSG